MTTSEKYPKEPIVWKKISVFASIFSLISTCVLLLAQPYTEIFRTFIASLFIMAAFFGVIKAGPLDQVWALSNHHHPL